MALTAAPKFYSIESVAYPGYYVTQQGTQIVLKSKDALNPFQDDSLLWSVGQSSDDQVSITMTVPVVTSTSGGSSRWKLVTYGNPLDLWPIPFDLLVVLHRAFSSVQDSVSLVWEVLDLEAVTFKDAIKHNDETNVVAVSPNNISLNGMRPRRYHVLHSFILINKVTGLALKGSTKPGDKVLLTQYDPLDYDFMWSENRFQASNTDYLAINLDGTNLQWALQNDDQYQNSAWYRHLQTKDI
ncbi:hypothetical protein SELMODRAFT_403712 [Selaginella moellendorffii]|uniref:Uncharacterized protein n=1 Tax=Selaginella moellendorffii TaxID=88036 RepID=D8QSA2_SELML|nr:hypothetical protein SELMODRAFT_403712 [Selaginella moellendorffii]